MAKYWVLIGFDNIQMRTQDSDGFILQHYQTVGIQIAPHLIETLTSLQEEGIGLVTLTHHSIEKTQNFMRCASNGKGQNLMNLFTSHYFEIGSPQDLNFRTYLRVMAELRTEPRFCFVVENRVIGVEAARAAGIKTFGYASLEDNPLFLEQSLLKAGASDIFCDWFRFEALLKKQIQIDQDKIIERVPQPQGLQV